MNQNTPYHLCFETLSNELRIQILKRLQDRAYSVSELCKELNEEQSKVSHSLSMLRTCNYVEVKQDGKKHIYSLKLAAVQGLKVQGSESTVFDIIDRHVATCCNFECKKLQSHLPVAKIKN